jgi:hypothetical protein
MKQTYNTRNFKSDTAKMFFSLGLGLHGGPVSTQLPPQRLASVVSPLGAKSIR